MTDPMAERARKIGGMTLHSIGEIARKQRIADNDADYVDPQDMLAELADDNRQCVAAMRSLHATCDEHSDVATASLLEAGSTRASAGPGSCSRPRAPRRTPPTRSSPAGGRKMEKRQFGAIGEVSRLTLGGGGIGQVWGDTSREEGIATLRMAVDAGIDVIDAAPGYKVCEALIGEAFGGRLPDGVRITTKCGIGSPPAAEVYPRLRASLEQSLAAMRLSRVDLFFLHNEICPDDFVYPVDNERRSRVRDRLVALSRRGGACLRAAAAGGPDRRLGHHRGGRPGCDHPARWRRRRARRRCRRSPTSSTARAA